MKLYSWYKVEELQLSELQEGKLTEVRAGERRVGLLKRGGMVMAFTAACPHAGSNLCEGWLDSLGRIVCPEHKYRFDPQTGRNTSGEGYRLFTYPVEIKADEIFIGTPLA